MYKITLMALLLLGLFATQDAVARPKHFYTDKWWWLGRGFSATAVGLDAWSTGSYLNVCSTCADSFPLFNVNSRGTIAGASIIDFAISTGFSVVEWHLGPRLSDGKPVDRLLGYFGQPAVDGALHGWAATTNWEFAARCRAAELSCN